MKRFIVFLLLVTLAVVEEVSGGCPDATECGPGECCVSGTIRYSGPSCKPIQQLNEACRPNNEANNGSITFPNGLTITYTNAYYVMCPCDVGLTCYQGVCISAPP